VGQVVHTLPEGRPVCGVTSLGDEVFVLRPKGEHDQIEVYDVITFCLQRCITVSNIFMYADKLFDMTSCEHFRCMYICDHDVEHIHRVDVDVQGTTTQWPVNDKPRGLSVTKAHNVLVTCDIVRKIKEFSSHGELLRELTLPDEVIKPMHAVQVTTGQYIVCHGQPRDALNRVCLVSADCHDVMRSHGGQPGSDTGQYKVPRYLAVDDNEFVFVSDVMNRRVTLLSPTLNYIRQVVSSDKLKWDPCRLHLDVQRRRLYVVDNERSVGKYTAGRVVVFSV